MACVDDRPCGLAAGGEDGERRCERFCGCKGAGGVSFGPRTWWRLVKVGRRGSIQFELRINKARRGRRLGEDLFFGRKRSSLRRAPGQRERKTDTWKDRLGSKISKKAPPIFKIRAASRSAAFFRGKLIGVVADGGEACARARYHAGQSSFTTREKESAVSDADDFNFEYRQIDLCKS